MRDRGYLDLERLYRLHEAGSFFVTRAKSNLKAERRYSHRADRASGLMCDQTVVLSGFCSHKGFPVPLRRIKYRDPKTDKRLIFPTNQFALPALSIADLYRSLTLFEQTPLDQLLARAVIDLNPLDAHNQMNLFE